MFTKKNYSPSPLPLLPTPLLLFLPLPATACTSAPKKEASAFTPPPTATSLTRARASGVFGLDSESVKEDMSYEMDTVGMAGLFGFKGKNFSVMEYW